MAETDSTSSAGGTPSKRAESPPRPSFDVYEAEVDGVTVVHVGTTGMREDCRGPIMRVYLNDEPIFENPPFPAADPLPPGDEGTNHWDDDPDYPVSDWQHEVAEGDTRRGYHQWVACQREADRA